MKEKDKNEQDKDKKYRQKRKEWIKARGDTKRNLHITIKSTLIAYMNGAMPQVAIEYGRKTVSAYDRPTIDQVEAETLGGGAAA